jgi:hypothetical protein
MPEGKPMKEPEQNDQSTVARLAQFFPAATPMRIPVCVTSTHGSKGVAPEETVIEFGTDREVLFSSTLPLEFDETVILRNPTGTLDAKGYVVAVQLGKQRSAIAVRFKEQVENWIIQPA